MNTPASSTPAELPSRSVSIGKRIRGALYVHRSAWREARHQIQEHFARQVDALLAKVEAEFNVVRIETAAGKVALLDYGNFFEEPFPALRRSRLYNMATGEISERTYGHSGNPPILHRKELLLGLKDTRRLEFEALTQQLESAGLFNDITRIGYRKAWLQRLDAAALSVQGHSLVGKDRNSGR